MNRVPLAVVWFTCVPRTPLHGCPCVYVVVFGNSSVCLNEGFSFRLELEKYCKEMVEPFTDIVSYFITACVLCVVCCMPVHSCTWTCDLCLVYSGHTHGTIILVICGTWVGKCPLCCQEGKTTSILTSKLLFLADVSGSHHGGL